MNAHSPLRIGVFGGTFDPVHVGHLLLATYALDTLQLDTLLIVPAGRPPHKPGQIVSSDDDRWAMLELATHGRTGFELSDVDLRQPGPSYTVNLLQRLRSQYPEDQLFFLIGADSLRDFHTWHLPGSIPALATIAVAGRPGVETDIAAAIHLTPELAGHVIEIDIPLIDVSATEIRERVRDGKPIWYQTPEAVERYIVEHQLYQEVPFGTPAHGSMEPAIGRELRQSPVD
jgi:nicotinate-nucleotide adenylyltransferase